MTTPPDEALSSPQREVMPSTLPPSFGAAEPTPKAPPLDLTTLDGLVEQHRWDKVREALQVGEAAALPPALRVVLALASRESEPVDLEARRSAMEAQRMAVEALAELLGMPPTATLPRVVAVRILRRNWRTAPAPTTRTSLLLLGISLALGSLVGYLLGPGRDWLIGVLRATG